MFDKIWQIGINILVDLVASFRTVSPKVVFEFSEPDFRIECFCQKVWVLVVCSFDVVFVRSGLQEWFNIVDIIETSRIMSSKVDFEFSRPDSCGKH